MCLPCELKMPYTVHGNSQLQINIPLLYISKRNYTISLCMITWVATGKDQRPLFNKNQKNGERSSNNQLTSLSNKGPKFNIYSRILLDQFITLNKRHQFQTCMIITTINIQVFFFASKSCPATKTRLQEYFDILRLNHQLLPNSLAKALWIREEACPKAQMADLKSREINLISCQIQTCLTEEQPC